MYFFSPCAHFALSGTAGCRLFGLYRFSNIGNFILPHGRYGRFSGKWSVCCNRTVYPLPRKKYTTDFICLSSLVLLLQYVHYQRRRTDHICAVDNYCIPHAWCKIKKMVNSHHRASDDCRQSGKYADSARQSTKSISLWKIRQQYWLFSSAYAAFYFRFASPSLCMDSYYMPPGIDCYSGKFWKKGIHSKSAFRSRLFSPFSDLPAYCSSCDTVENHFKYCPYQHDWLQSENF